MLRTHARMMAEVERRTANFWLFRALEMARWSWTNVIPGWSSEVEEHCHEQWVMSINQINSPRTCRIHSISQLDRHLNADWTPTRLRELPFAKVEQYCEWPTRPQKTKTVNLDLNQGLRYIIPEGVLIHRLAAHKHACPIVDITYEGIVMYRYHCKR